jgi:hypothetical protein
MRHGGAGDLAVLIDPADVQPRPGGAQSVRAQVVGGGAAGLQDCDLLPGTLRRV